MSKNKKDFTQPIFIKHINHKGYLIMAQNIGTLFQCIIVEPGAEHPFRALHIDMTDTNDYGDENLDKMITIGGNYVLNQAVATVETLLNKDNPDELLKDNALGYDVLQAVESLDKQKGTQNANNKRRKKTK